MKKILTEAAAVGNATARAITFRTRLKGAYYYPKSAWFTPFIGGSYQFLTQPACATSMPVRFSTTTQPALRRTMAAKMVGVGSQYAVATVDSEGNGLDGKQDVRIHLPPSIPAKQFWSFVVYDNETRSMLNRCPVPEHRQQQQRHRCERGHLGRRLIGPIAPAGHESNWVQTVPGKGWNVLLRLYGPGQSWFDKT